MGILKDIREFPADLEFARKEAGPGTALLITAMFAARLLVPIAPIALYAYIVYLSARDAGPIPSDGKIFLIVSFFCALGLGALAALIFGWFHDTDKDE